MRIKRDCGAQTVKKGKKQRILLTRDGREVKLDREYAVSPACGQMQNEEVEYLERKMRQAAVGADKLLISADGVAKLQAWQGPLPTHSSSENL